MGVHLYAPQHVESGCPVVDETNLKLCRIAVVTCQQYNRPVVGVGCTGSLVTTVPKRGAHRVWVAVSTREYVPPPCGLVL